MKVVALGVSIGAVAASILPFQQARQNRQGGPIGEFLSKTPVHDLSVVTSAVRKDGAILSMVATKDLTVQSRTGAKYTLKANTPTSVDLPHLESNARHTIEFSWEGGESSVSFTTARKAGTSFDFAIQADSHLDENSSADTYVRSLDNIKSFAPDFLIDLGDTFMTGKHKAYNDALPQYLAQHYYFGRCGVPVFLVLGNHDGEQGWIERGQVGMSEWSAQTRKSFFPPLKPGTNMTGDTERANYYEFSWGDAQFIVLDPFNPTKVKPARDGNGWGWTLGEAQYRWLKSTLEKSKSRFKFVFIHHLVGGLDKNARGGAEAAAFYEWGGKSKDETEGFASHRPAWDFPIHQLLLKHRVQAVFHGHDHFYNKQDKDGIVYQLVPQPSHARGGSTRSATEYGYASGKIVEGSGFVLVHVDPNSARVQFVKTGPVADPRSIADQYTLKP